MIMAIPCFLFVATLYWGTNELRPQTEASLVWCHYLAPVSMPGFWAVSFDCASRNRSMYSALVVPIPATWMSLVVFKLSRADLILRLLCRWVVEFFVDSFGRCGRRLLARGRGYFHPYFSRAFGG